MKACLDITSPDRHKNVGTTINLLCLGRSINNYIGVMSPMELSIFKTKIEMAESLLDNSSGDISIE